MWSNRFDESFLFSGEPLMIWCESEEDAASLFEILDRNGFMWNNGDILSPDDTSWFVYGRNTCYVVATNRRVTYRKITKEKPLYRKCMFRSSDVHQESYQVSQDDIKALLF